MSLSKDADLKLKKKYRVCWNKYCYKKWVTFNGFSFIWEYGIYIYMCACVCEQSLSLAIKFVLQPFISIYANWLSLQLIYFNILCKCTSIPPLSLYIIIIIMSCRPHGYPWPSLATFPPRSSPPAGLLDYIPYLHIAAVCMFELVVLLLLGHKWGSIGVHDLWARLFSSSSVLRAWFF